MLKKDEFPLPQRGRDFYVFVTELFGLEYLFSMGFNSPKKACDCIKSKMYLLQDNAIELEDIIVYENHNESDKGNYKITEFYFCSDQLNAMISITLLARIKVNTKIPFSERK